MRKGWKNLGAVVMAMALGMAVLNGCAGGKAQDAADQMEAEASAGDLTDSQPEEGEADEGAAGPETESSSLEADRTKETAPAMEDRDETVYVTGDKVNLRKDGYLSAEVAEVVPIGTELKRTGYSDTWSRVEYDGSTLYISTQYVSTSKPEIPEQEPAGTVLENGGVAVAMDPSWEFADYSKINSGTATLYKSQAADKKGITVCVNAGHGTQGGSSVKTLCHPDGSPKVVTGSTQAGATSAIAVSAGMEFLDGTPEAKVTLAAAKIFKEKLLAEGYDVLMIRETDDVQLDNIARTVIANNMADCHLALHWDSSTNDKGAFYMSVPDIASYKNMYPVSQYWQQHNALGESVIGGLRNAGVKIFSNGAMGMDLTQTSYSTIPSIDIELGDKGSDYSQPTLEKLAAGMVAGINAYFGK